jgi:uncharacterized membrane protein (UPF0127 family)
MSVGVAIGALFLMDVAGCVGAPSTGAAAPPSATQRDFPLDRLKTSTITIEGPAAPGQDASQTARRGPIRVWLALSSEQHQEGLMYVPADEIADDQGMLFVFPDERMRGFWMKNTITGLDIAFARMDGTIVAIHTMPPLTLETFSSFEPAMFALEVKAGTFSKLGVVEGDKLAIPDEVFKATP